MRGLGEADFADEEDWRYLERRTFGGVWGVCGEVEVGLDGDVLMDGNGVWDGDEDIEVEIDILFDGDIVLGEDIVGEDIVEEDILFDESKPLSLSFSTQSG